MSRFLLYVCVHLYSLLLESFRFFLPVLDSKGTRYAKLLVRERFGLPPAKKRVPEAVWIHASSLGEAKVLYTFLKIMEGKYPKASFVLTAVTKTGVDYLRRHTTDSVCAVGFLPFDTIPLMDRMIRQFTITRLWLVETEIWPAMLWACLQNKIPVGIVNARMEKKSFDVYHFFKTVLKPLFEHMDVILAQDTVYATRFASMGASANSIHTTGNLKSRIIINHSSAKQRDTLRRSMKLNHEHTVITAGCIHPREAVVIRKAADILNTKGYQWKWIVVPRHLEKTFLILEELGNNTLHTKTLDLSDDWNMCCIEKIGILEDMYMISDAAVIGGTFIHVGGHNVWEAVQYAIPVFFGPDYHKQRDSCGRILNAGVGFCVDNAEELAGGLIKVLGTDTSGFSSNMSTLIKTMKGDADPMEPYLP